MLPKSKELRRSRLYLLLLMVIQKHHKNAKLPGCRNVKLSFVFFLIFFILSFCPTFFHQHNSNFSPAFLTLPTSKFSNHQSLPDIALIKCRQSPKSHFLIPIIFSIAPEENVIFTSNVIGLMAVQETV